MNLSMSYEGWLIRNRNDANSVKTVGTEQVDIFSVSSSCFAEFNSGQQSNVASTSTRLN